MFFHNSWQPLLPRLHCCKRPYSALNVMRVYSHSYWLVIFVQPIAAECWRGKGGKLLRIPKNKHNIYRTPCMWAVVACLILNEVYVSVKDYFHTTCTFLIRLYLVHAIFFLIKSKANHFSA